MSELEERKVKALETIAAWAPRFYWWAIVFAAINTGINFGG